MSEPGSGSLASRIGPIPGDAPAATPSAPQPGVAPPAESKAEEKAPEDDLVKNRYNVAVKLANEQGDPNSPLFSVKHFEDLGL